MMVIGVLISLFIRNENFNIPLLSTILFSNLKFTYSIKKSLYVKMLFTYLSTFSLFGQ